MFRLCSRYVQDISRVYQGYIKGISRHIIDISYPDLVIKIVVKIIVKIAVKIVVKIVVNIVVQP